MAKYQKYAEYKDSGLEWLGDIPSHWVTTRFKFCCDRVVVGIAEAATHAYADEGVPILRSTNIRESGLDTQNILFIKQFFADQNDSKYLYVNDIITVRTGYPGISSVVPQELDKSQCFTNLISTPNKKFDPHFLTFFLNSDIGKSYFELLGWGSAQKNISVPILQNFFLAIPILSEQKLIVSFLDHETAKIDTLIAKQEKLIELLKEKRQAVISHAVTKGLNPNVPMKDSGVEWLGEVPEHWAVTKVGFHTLKIGSGKTPKGGAEIYQDEGVLFIRSQNVYNDGLRVDSSESTYISEAIHDDMSTSKVYSGDILLNITGGSIGRSSLVPDEFPEANVNQHVCIIRVRRYLQEFLALVIQSDLIQAQLRSIQTGGNREGLNFEQISKFWFVLPPNDEQEQIISFIQNKLNEFGELEARANKAIHLMQERRTAIISAAVTGKIDVRHWQHPNQKNNNNTELSA